MCVFRHHETLFCQGDFARILMEMLGEELSKPAHSAMRHNITGIVEAALRTSASAGEDTVYDHGDCRHRLSLTNLFWQIP